jgi:hypothetical protein
MVVVAASLGTVSLAAAMGSPAVATVVAEAAEPESCSARPPPPSSGA